MAPRNFGGRGSSFMPEFLQSASAQIVFWVAVTAIAVAIGIYVVSRVRVGMRITETPVNDMLTNFRELHSRGELSDGEYRTIKATLSARLERELKDSGKEG